MKFVPEFPRADGYYYFVDMEYPIPRIGFLYMRGHACFIQEPGKATYELPYSLPRNRFRFGPRIELPECEDIVTEASP